VKNLAILKKTRNLASNPRKGVNACILSKIRWGDGQLRQAQTHLLAQIVQADKEGRQTLWLAGQVPAVGKDEKGTNEAT